ncbi:integrase arm-type DNA-binding domain-containing protein [Sphingomonas sp. DG1-23]|uniref:tyrosine-type recombinase/integrase n=1 Tax=Sphingomonas sp. DG1-23 TaxID=3068316 RepID=UPI00273EB86F|nr:integrase arm-type DNA-binding domain-containing protein [Sphingomonas sp. DG1-23]MDP5279940.1 integrase arm-type DNA-binding domain-containing protein [Sphingomonas sp. DG1-23]
MPLTDIQCKKAAPGEKDYKLSDSGGLYLFVTTKGAKSWRLKYRFAGREKRLVMGLYPDVTLKDARDRRDDAKKLLREHKDPLIEERKRKAAAHSAAGATFKVVAERWYAAQLGRWARVNATKIAQALKRDVYPEIGALPLVDIDGPTVLALLRKIEKRGAIDSAKRIRQHISAVFGYGMAEGLCFADPAGQHLLKAMLPTPVGGSQPGLGSIEEIRELHATVDASTGCDLTKLASRLLGLTFVRPGLIPTARWEEFEGIDWNDPSGAGDAEEPAWRIRAERMKLEQDNKADDAFEHIVPLVPQAVDVLRAVRRLSGRFPYLFHSVRSTHKPMSANTLGYRYNECGYRDRHVPHGWRTSFSTIMNERATLLDREGDRAVIDAMLSHKPRGISAAEMAYNRARHMPRRWELARWWADETMKGLVPANELVAWDDRAC